MYIKVFTVILIFQRVEIYTVISDPQSAEIILQTEVNVDPVGGFSPESYNIYSHFLRTHCGKICLAFRSSLFLAELYDPLMNRLCFLHGTLNGKIQINPRIFVRNNIKACILMPDFSENTGYLKARDWYNNYGRMRIARLIRDLQEEGIQEAWIRPDGICNVNTEKGYRRRAILTDFPSGHMYEIAKWTKAEQIAGARVSGKYIRLSVPERAS